MLSKTCEWCGLGWEECYCDSDCSPDILEDPWENDYVEDPWADDDEEEGWEDDDEEY